jgi:hypothetical protein
MIAIVVLTNKVTPGTKRQPYAQLDYNYEVRQTTITNATLAAAPDYQPFTKAGGCTS